MNSPVFEQRRSLVLLFIQAGTTLPEMKNRLECPLKANFIEEFSVPETGTSACPPDPVPRSQTYGHRDQPMNIESRGSRH